MDRMARRMGGGVTMGGSGAVNSEEYEQNKIKAALYQKVIERPDIIKRLKNVGAHISAGPGGTGETNIASDGTPLISIGVKGLTSEDVALTVVLHELDHAKLMLVNRPMKLGRFVVTNVVDQTIAKRKAGSYEYELEELIVRLRDYQRLIKGKIVYPKVDAVSRVKAQMETLKKVIGQMGSGDLDDFDVAGTMKKVAQIIVDLDLQLD